MSTPPPSDTVTAIPEADAITLIPATGSEDAPSAAAVLEAAASEDEVDGIVVADAASSTGGADIPDASSRTSTPPIAAAPKRFSAVNVTKKFLSKTGSPASQPGQAKLAPAARPSASPVPISSSSRLLSTKLTTLPSSKSGTSPIPPPPIAASSPWAKHPEPSPSSSLQHPSPAQGRLVGVPIGLGQGLGAKGAWRAVSDARPGAGLNRDFPTAKEVADGKKAATLARQAEAAHNQAIMQSLNAFTQLDPNAHRWDEDDEDDDVLDFGDGAELHDVDSVPKGERFVEDFDRSWPQRDLRPESSRVLFNANLNRLEPTRPRPGPQPTGLATRPSEPPLSHIPRHPLPHLQTDSGRMLPPHMQAPPQSLPEPRPPSPHRARPEAHGEPRYSARQPWGAQREMDRPLPPHLAPVPSTSRQPPAPTPHPHPPPHAAPRMPPVSATSPTAHAAPITHAAPAAHAVTSPTIPVISPTSVPVDLQAAEMHTAAEKARQRRLAEEAEREAAAERARRKAKELEERFGPKQEKVESHSRQMAAAPPAPPPGFPAGSVTLAQRPKASPAVPAQPSHAARESWRRLEEPQVQAPEPVPETRPIPPPFEPDTLLEATAPAKKESTFDSMLARIQAAMAEARQSPLPSEPSPELPAAAPLKPLPTPATEYFDVTQLDPPRSPPPAWRTFIIRLPKDGPARPPVPQSQLYAFETATESAPRGWLMSYHPPLDVNPRTQSVADILLPVPLARRFQKHVDVLPVVSISPRQLQPFERKKKKVEPVRQDPVVPDVSAEALLPDLTPVSSRWHKADPEATSSPSIPPPPAPPAPSVPVVPPSAPAPERVDRGGAQPRSGVRFMVSSELEGDSLLDEVNKISLETVDEGSFAPRKVQTQTPQTPPPHSGASTRNNPSPNGASTPWSRSSVRSDHLKSVWAESGPSPPVAEAPTYPSLNAPSSADPPASQPLPKTFNAFGSGVAGGMAPTARPYPSNEAQMMNYGGPRASLHGMGQQGVWSSAAFGTSMTSPSYGFKPGSMDQKAMQAFNGAKDSINYGGYPQATTYQQSYGNDFSQSNQAFGRQNVTSPQMYAGYAYGAPNQAQRANVGGRFGQGNGEYGNIGFAGEGTYYGGVSQQLYGPGYGGVGAGAVGQPANRGGPGSGGGGGGGGGAGRKMW